MLRGLSAKPGASPRIPVGSPYQRSFLSAYEDLQKQRDMEHIEAMFRAADTDRSGSVSYAEFETCMRDAELFAILNRRFGFQRHETPRIFRALDLDASGTVSVE